MKITLKYKRDYYFKDSRTLTLIAPVEVAGLHIRDIEKLFLRKEAIKISVGLFDWVCCQVYFLKRRLLKK